ncbi:hypothetical protein CCP4SC76_6750001 [Gammaproteobacteria bacterium]
MSNLPDTAVSAILGLITNRVQPSNLVLRLYTNDRTPSDIEKTLDYQEATGSGYAPILVPPSAWVFSKGSVTTTQAFIFTASHAPVFGWMLTQQATGTLMEAERFMAAPIAIPGAGYRLKLDISIELIRSVPPGPTQVLFDMKPGSKTWLCPETGYYQVSVVGAGGGGSNNKKINRGGDGGGYALLGLRINSGTSVAYIVGAGGTPGVAGGKSSWSTLLQATGGHAGNLAALTGVGTKGDINLTGSPGTATGTGGQSASPIPGIGNGGYTNLANKTLSGTGGNGAVMVEKVA